MNIPDEDDLDVEHPVCVRRTDFQVPSNQSTGMFFVSVCLWFELWSVYECTNQMLERCRSAKSPPKTLTQTRLFTFTSHQQGQTAFPEVMFHTACGKNWTTRRFSLDRCQKRGEDRSYWVSVSIKAAKDCITETLKHTHTHFLQACFSWLWAKLTERLTCLKAELK